jgi:uncharacterized protein involved in exopolysaccharide biosynthesis
VRSWIRLAARLYPARWRQRYGAEFDALLEDATPTWRNAVDVGWSALEMHMNMWSFPKLAVVCGLAGAILAAAMAVRMPDKYTSEAVLRVSGDEQSPQVFLDRVIQRALSRSSLGELIQKNDLYATDRQRMPLEDVIERMRHDIAITVANSATADPKNFAFVVRYVYRDPAQAQRTTYELASKIVEENLAEAMRTNQAKSDAERRSTGTTLQILGLPSLPQRPSRPNRLLITALGVAAGLALAVLAAVAMRLRRPAAPT